MSAKMMGKVWELVLTPAKQVVLLAYADHADHEGENIRPGIPLIAWKTGYSERQAQRITKQLVDDGLLVVRDVRRGKPTRYGLDFSKGVTKPAFKLRDATAGGDILSPPTPDNLTPVSAAPPDKMSPLTPDKMSGRQDDGVTSHESDAAQGGDIASAEMTRIRQKDQPSVNAKDKTAAAAFSLESFNAAAIWENEMGAITPLIADTLRDWEKDYPAGWAADAIREAKLSGGQSLKYVGRILERWRREGKGAAVKRGQARNRGTLAADAIEFGQDGSHYVTGKFAEFIEH